MTIDNNQAISHAQSSLRRKATTAGKNNGELEKQDFMNLFLTQMSNQDPVDPMDSGAMMNQLAQLGTLEQLEKMNGQFTDLNSTQKDISRFQSLMMLDKDVMIEAKDVELSHGTGKPVYYSLDGDANNIKVVIEDSEGLPVFAESLGLTSSGKHQFIWNGKNDEGVLMPDGKYNIRFTAYDQGGNASDIALFSSGKVGQVEYEDGKTWVRMNDQRMPLSKVKNISTLSNRTFGKAEPLPYITELTPKKLVDRDDLADQDSKGQKINLSQ
jgi:flagellar basal-body rod modification protein FlgD